MTMPAGWSVSPGQTFLYTKEEKAIVPQARAVAQREIRGRGAARAAPRPRQGLSEDARRGRHDGRRGEELGALAITEPQIGSDTSRMETHAVKRGDRWIINGQKCFITDGGLAD